MSGQTKLVERLWAKYVGMAPQVETIWKALNERGGPVVADHIALRTFSHPSVDIEVLDRGLVSAGYEPADSYEIPERHLYACHYDHPRESMPRVFISSLLLDECSAELKSTVADLLSHVQPGACAHPEFAASGRHWPLSSARYEALREESEYAAWLAVFGFCANHFAIDVGRLSAFSTLEEVNGFVDGLGFAISGDGGEIKGSPEVYLEQSSTIADEIEVELDDRKLRLPSCYCEFVKRHRQPTVSCSVAFSPVRRRACFQAPTIARRATEGAHSGRHCNQKSAVIFTAYAKKRRVRVDGRAYI